MAGGAMDGYLAARRQASQEQAQQLQSLTGLAALHSQMQEQQLLPLRARQLQAQAEETTTLGDLLKRYMTVKAEGQPQTSGGALARLHTDNAGAPNVASAAPAQARSPLALPPDVELALLHPRLQALGKVQAEAFKPTDKMREAVALGYQPGTPQFAAYVGDTATQGGIWRTTPTGDRTLAPGYASGMGAIKKAEAGAQAGFDVVDVKLPDGSSVQMPRDRAVQNLGGSPPGAPAPGVAISPQVQMQRDGVRLRMLEAEAQRNPGDANLQRELTDTRARLESGRPFGGVATASIVPSLGRSQSPQDAAREKEIAESFGKLYSNVLNAEMQAGGAIGKYRRLGNLLSMVHTGKWRGTTQQLKATAKSIGFDLNALGVADDVSAAQAGAALSNQLALELRNPAGGAGMPGAMSDQDREFLTRMVPSIENDPAAIPAMIEYRIKLANRDKEVSKLARDYRKRTGRFDEGFFDELAAFSERNPLFPKPDDAGVAIRDAKPAGPPRRGQIESGWVFMGGDPGKPSSWQGQGAR